MEGALRTLGSDGQPRRLYRSDGCQWRGKIHLLRTLAGLYSQYSGEYETTSFLYQGHRLGLDGLLSPLENLAWFAGLEGNRAIVTPTECTGQRRECSLKPLRHAIRCLPDSSAALPWRVG